MNQQEIKHNLEEQIKSAAQYLLEEFFDRLNQKFVGALTQNTLYDFQFTFTDVKTSKDGPSVGFLYYQYVQDLCFKTLTKDGWQCTVSYGDDPRRPLFTIAITSPIRFNPDTFIFEILS